MAIIQPFKGIRPKAELAPKVASLPYDVMNSEEAREAAKDNPQSFLYVIKPEISFAQGYDAYSTEIYEKGRENFYDLLESGTIVQDDEAYMYIYEQEMHGIVQTGLVAASSVDDYWNDVIKKHEFTRPVKEQDRINHMKATGIQAGPIFLTYPNVDAVDEIVARQKQQDPDSDFIAEDGVRHTVWVIRDMNDVSQLALLFDEQVPFTYIADGHHRAASASKVGKEMQEANPDRTGEESYNFFLSVLFPANQLRIMDYNRVVTDLNGLSEKSFIETIEEKFTVTRHKEGAYKPAERQHYGMYLGDKWYELTPKPGLAPENDPVNSLDIAVLQNNLLAPVLGIENPRTDERIDFIGGIRGMQELEKRVNSGEMAVAFSLFPVSIEELIAIADSGNVMPPKSTWFEPKLRSGLIVHRFK